MSEDEVKLLTITRLRQNDTGIYLCRVLNEYGFNDLIHHLTVLSGKFICFCYVCFYLIRKSKVHENFDCFSFFISRIETIFNIDKYF